MLPSYSHTLIAWHDPSAFSNVSSLFVSCLFDTCQSTPTAAEKLDKATVDRIQKAISGSKIAKEYKSLKVSNKVHSDLLGGVIVDFGDEKTIDLSVKSRVQKLDQLITREFTISDLLLGFLLYLAYSHACECVS
jgi:hypothetical protein